MQIAVRPGLGAELLWCALAMIISLAAVIVTWRLWHAHLHIPIFEPKGDSAWTLATVKGIMEHGWYETNSTLAAPFGQLSYDFPAYAGETGKVLLVKVLALFSSDPIAVLNIALILGFPLIAGITYLVMRRLRFSRGVAVVCSVLFATSPIHFVLAPGQAWIASYFGIPLSGYLILRMLGEAPLFTRSATATGIRQWLGYRNLGIVGICVLIGLLGLNYAEFTCLLVGIAAILVFLTRRRVATLLTAVVIIVAITIPVLASAAPDLLYRAQHGTNQEVARREPVESFEYGLQPIQLVLPLVGDRIPAFANFTSEIDASLESGFPNVPEDLGPQISLGIVSAVGLVWILWLMFGGLLGREVKDARERLATNAGIAALLAILLAAIGGGAILFAYVVTAQIQVWARIAILIGFFAIVGLGDLLERARQRIGSPLLTGIALLLILAAGVFEGTTDRFIPDYAQINANWRSDAAFVTSIQQSMPRDAMILELPYVPYPEGILPTGLTSYEPLIPYLHSTTLRWSAGAMKGRSADWLAHASTLPVDQLIKGSVAAGFAGVYVLRSGYADHGAAVEAAIRSLTGEAPLVEEGGAASFFSLTRYAERLRARTSPRGLAALARAVGLSAAREQA